MTSEIKLVPDGPYVIVGYGDIDMFAICASRGLEGLFLFLMSRSELIDMDHDMKLKVVGVDMV